MIFKYTELIHDVDPKPISGRRQDIYIDNICVGRILYLKDGAIESAMIDENFQRKGIYRAALLDCLEKYNESLVSFSRNDTSENFWKKFERTVLPNIKVEHKKVDNNWYYILSKL